MSPTVILHYDKKFYALVQALCYWRYLLPQEFVLYSDHEALKYFNSQKSLNANSKWVKFLQDYTFVLKHKMRVENKIADVLSWRVIILIAMSIEVTGFERLREEDELCPDFGEKYTMLWDRLTLEIDVFLLHDEYLFRFRKLCITHTSFRDFLSWKLYAGGMAGHSGQIKTIEPIEHRFYWPSLKRDVVKIVGQCRTCRLAKK